MPTPQVSMRSGDSSATPVSPWVTASEADQENAQDRKHITKLKRDKMYLKDLLKEMGQFVDIIRITAYIQRLRQSLPTTFN